MQTVHCDICKTIIKYGDRKYVLGIYPSVQDLDYRSLQDIQDILLNPNKNPHDIQVFEICSSCKKILEYLFTIRIEKLKQLEKDMSKIYEEE